jgi:hypothetical protein
MKTFARTQAGDMAPRSDLRYSGKEQITGDTDQHEVYEQDEGPAHVVTNHSTFVAHELRGGHADTRSLRRDRLPDLGSNRRTSLPFDGRRIKLRLTIRGLRVDH